MPYQLIHAGISDDTVAACKELLEAAEAGHVTGLGVVVVLKRRRFTVDVLGEAARDPVFTRGALQSLDDCLRELVRRRADTASTM